MKKGSLVEGLVVINISVELREVMIVGLKDILDNI